MTNRTFYSLLRPKTEYSRPESISLLESQWAYIDRDATRNDSNRSRWFRAAAEYVRLKLELQESGAGIDETAAAILETQSLSFQEYLRTKTEPCRGEKISLPDDLWTWIDDIARRRGSDRSKVCQAIVAVVMAGEQVTEA